VETADKTLPDVMVVPPDGGEHYWQPVPANGHINVRLAPHMVHMTHRFGFGTQTVAPGCYVREHTHPDHDEVIHVVSGTGKAVLNGEEREIVPGTTVYIGKTNRHMFIASDNAELTFAWILVPNGLETFFKEIGRPMRPGDPAPEPFPRPENVHEIERRTVFGEPIADTYKKS